MSKQTGNYDDEIITINVGGRHFTTFKSTLLRFSHSLLARMVSGSIPMRKDRDSRIFLDRDPNLFDFILQYLRSSKIDLTDDQVSQYLAQLIQEAEYFMIDPLLDQLRAIRNNLNKKDVLLVWNEGGVIKFNCTDEDVLAHLDYLKPPIVGLKKTRSIATIQYDCDFLVAINHFINNGFTRPDIMSSKINYFWSGTYIPDRPPFTFVREGAPDEPSQYITSSSCIEPIKTHKCDSA
jgi:hypothetical protein